MVEYKNRFSFGAGAWILGASLILLIIAVPAVLSLPKSPERIKSPWASIIEKRTHLDHSGLFKMTFKRPQDVTRACLKCHADSAKDFMKTAHWNWERDPAPLPGRKGLIKLGKKNLINNFCIGIKGNWASCSSCHPGYGWGGEETFDFAREENVDCLVCHDWSGTYAKGPSGMPAKGIDLLLVAESVGYPKRDNCGICHIYGGGGMGVKHGDLDQTLVNAKEDVDVHMGRYDLLCIDCHKTDKHLITGKAFSISVNHDNGIACADCHTGAFHRDRRIESHLESVACETCHIPTYAKRAPTKMHWDWSKAGDSSRKENAHEYLKIKGEFIYGQNIIPEYYWFNLTVDRYIVGDTIDPDQATLLNPPGGDISDFRAKIWPFKVHRAKQPYDKSHKHLLLPVTSGEGGYWHDFDWDQSFRIAEQFSNIRYSGSYGFTRTIMFWPLAHMVSPADKALKCDDCHGEKSRMNWKALGYTEDPVDKGGRKELGLILAKEHKS